MKNGFWYKDSFVAANTELARLIQEKRHAEAEKHYAELERKFKTVCPAWEGLKARIEETNKRLANEGRAKCDSSSV